MKTATELQRRPFIVLAKSLKRGGRLMTADLTLRFFSYICISFFIFPLLFLFFKKERLKNVLAHDDTQQRHVAYRRIRCVCVFARDIRVNWYFVN